MRSSDYLQRFVRSRLVRLTLAIVLIAVSVWAFFPHVRYRIASSAFVNAELMRVAAPIAGRLTRDLPRKGDFVEKPASVTLVEALARDQRHLLQLTSQYNVAKEHASLLRKQLAEIDATSAELAKRAQIYRESMVARLEREIEESKAERVGCLAEAKQRRDIASRMEQLVKGGTASEIRTAEAMATHEAASTRCEMADARMKRLQVELAAAKDGVFLRDGANDAPYSQQQRDRLALRRQELEIKVLEESLKTSQLESEMEAERERIRRLSHFDLALPTNHVVWSVAASPGSTVSEGQTLLDLAACENRFVVVELPEREFEQIKAGAPAYVRLFGSEEWKQGQVRQVRGSAARTDDRLLAARVPKPEANSITVEVGLPDDGTATDRNNFCNIGRLAEVRFQRSGFALFDGLGRTVHELTRYFRRDAAPMRTASK